MRHAVSRVFCSFGGEVVEIGGSKKRCARVAVADADAELIRENVNKNGKFR